MKLPYTLPRNRGSEKKFANGAMSAAFVVMFNDWKGTLAGAGAGKGAEKASEALGVNKSMTNVIKGGAGGLAGGAIAGTAIAGFPVGTVSGGILGLGGGLIKGAAFESFGVYDFIGNTIDSTIETIQEIGQGIPKTYEYIRCGHGGC
ncbi:MAG: hypothetical protein PHS85_10275 [Sulfurovum sp.]|nr:hypothetical protein [Sulfurovum sp.]